ncbi:thiamine pyrophosphate-binding protein [Streptomyces sp. RK31]|uniref:thiamine pyrophosphate-binding protein n=1 Tax=Streptomyces sp. RK31 TaxID=2824892 RepID=UPI001B39AE53|nr:thiamine pyrophosphate-binding protein [Streptomyces sp. RK31]MBQ0976122.1 thiamine pyrophosphate-binding protein [Streptomyces sp. RK31]
MVVKTGADVLVETLIRCGVRKVFGVPGGPLLALLDRLHHEPDLEFVLARHEEGAVFMAEGYAQTSGRLGVACVTSGPGAMHALTATASATSDGVPLLLLSGQPPVARFGQGALQDSSGGNWSADVVETLRSATKMSTLVTDVRQLAFMATRAVGAATAPVPGASHLSCATDVLTAPAPAAPPRFVPVVSPMRVAADEVQTLAQALQRARHPVVLAGQGAKLARAHDPLLAVAERLSLPVATTLKGKSVFPERHALSLGVFGMYGASHTAHNSLLTDEVDLLLVLGSSLGEVATAGWDRRLIASRTIWQVDADVRQLGRGMPIDHALHCDVRALLEDLLACALPQIPARTAPPAPHTPVPLTPAEALKGSQVAAILDHRLPRDTLLFVDNGNALCWIGEHYRSGDGREMYCSLNVGCMGYALPAAIGARVARPDRPVLAVMGDAAFAMTCSEIHTAVQEGIPSAWLVFNNQGNAMVANLQELMYERVTGSMYSHPIDAAAVARGFGARAITVRDAPTLESALDEVFKATATGSVPYLLDVYVDPYEMGWSLRARAESLAGGS